MSGTPVAPNSTAPPRPYGKALILLLVVLVAAGGWPGFKSAKYHLAIQRARREIARKDFNHAEFWGEQALSVNPNSPDAARVMAEINEAQDMPESLSWRIRVVQLAPESIPDHMAWAKCAVRFEHDQMARRALESLPDTFKPKSAEYNELMAGLASKGGMSAAAGFFFPKRQRSTPEIQSTRLISPRSSSLTATNLIPRPRRSSNSKRSQRIPWLTSMPCAPC